MGSNVLNVKILNIFLKLWISIGDTKIWVINDSILNREGIFYLDKTQKISNFVVIFNCFRTVLRKPLTVVLSVIEI